MMLIKYFDVLNLISSVTDLSNVLGELNSLRSVPYNWLFLLVIGIVVSVTVIYLLNKNQVKTIQNISEQALQIQDQVLDEVREQTTEIGDFAQEKINIILEEYQKFLPYAEELGLKVDSFSIEAGVLPQIKTSLRGSIDNIKSDVIERIKAENNHNKLLMAVLNAILLAKQCNDKLESIYVSILKDIIVDIKLGIPPAISVRFQ